MGIVNFRYRFFFVYAWSLLTFLGISDAQSLTPEEVNQIGYSIDSTLYNEDASYLSEMFSDSMFYKEVLIDPGADERLASFNDNFTTNDIGGMLAKRFINVIKVGASYDYLHYWIDEHDNYYLLFRFHNDGNLNYHQYFLTQDIKGKYVISDLYIFVTGQYFSETMTNIYQPLVSSLLDGEDQEIFEAKSADVLLFSKISKLIAAQELTAARAVYDTELTEEAKNGKIGHLYLLQLIDIEKEEEEYVKLLEAMSKDGERNPAFYLIGIDKFILSGQYQKSLDCIDTIYSYTGDEFLDLSRGFIYLGMDSISLAEQSFQNMIENFPLYAESYDYLLYCQVLLREYSRGVNTIEYLFDRLEIDVYAYDSILLANYPQFTSSSEYTNWVSIEKERTPKLRIEQSSTVDKKLSVLTVWQEEQNKKFKDPDKSPLTPEDRESFEQLDFYPYDSAYRITARLETLSNGRIFEMKTTTDRRPKYKEYGIAYFTINGQDLHLKIYQNVKSSQSEDSKNQLFLPFYDATSGSTTYAGGRYIMLEIPEEEEIIIDFNEAFNPYCAYSHAYSCPITPYENNLQMIAIEAGTKDYGMLNH